MIYLDNNATTRVLAPVAEVVCHYLSTDFANVASAIGEYQGTAQKVAGAKSLIAKILGAEEGRQIIVTSGATEANNLALLGAARAHPTRRHVLVSAIEHPSVLEVGRHLVDIGYEVSVVPVSKNGIVEPDAVMRMLRPDTLLVSVMLANNETGIIQPVSEVAGAIKTADPEVIFHTDATQAVGKLPIDLSGQFENIDLLSFSAHKFHGPKGVGGLFLREPNLIAPVFFGGGQQSALRPGTENVAGLMGMATAIELVVSAKLKIREMEAMRSALERVVTSIFPSAFVVGASSPRLPNTLCFGIPGIRGDQLVDYFATRGIAISVGSACAHGARRPSHVLLAMGLPEAQADGCVRVSLSIETTKQEADNFAGLLKSAVESTRVA